MRAKIIKQGKDKPQPSIKAAMRSSSGLGPQQQFNRNLARALIAGSISFNALNGPLAEFLRAHIKMTIPSYSTCVNYLEPLHKETIEGIKSKMQDQDALFILDESPDRMERRVLNILVAPLNGQPMKPMLLKVCFLDLQESLDFAKVQEKFLDCCALLWGDSGASRLIIVLTDMASYNLKAFRELKSHKKLHHITCIVHSLHGAAEYVKKKFSKAEPLVINMKKVLKHSRENKALYKRITNLPYPPQPVKTRWGTYIQSAVFISQNFDKIAEFVAQIRDSSVASKDLKSQVKSNIARNELRFTAHYKFLVDTIKQLESESLDVESQIELMDQAMSQMGTDVKEHLVDNLKKNPGYAWIKDPTDDNGLSNPQLALQVRYVPLNSVAAERTFSSYKQLLRDNRCSLSEVHISQQLVISHNAKILSN